jgi:hypothetical protein
MWIWIYQSVQDIGIEHTRVIKFHRRNLCIVITQRKESLDLICDMLARSPRRYSELKRVIDELGSRVSQLTNDNNEIVPRTTLEIADLLLIGRNLIMGILTETLLRPLTQSI